MNNFATTLVVILAGIATAVCFGFNVACVFCCDILWMRILSFISCLIGIGYIGLLIGFWKGGRL